MKKSIKLILLFVISLTMFGCQNQVSQDNDTKDVAKQDVTLEETKKISVTSNSNTTIFELNESEASDSLYKQLPLTIEVENYSDNEKIFYLPEELSISDAPSANGTIGILAYYAPWGDVVMFYDDFSSVSGLYELGQAVSGSEYIDDMSGTIEMTQYLE